MYEISLFRYEIYKPSILVPSGVPYARQTRIHTLLFQGSEIILRSISDAVHPNMTRRNVAAIIFIFYFAKCNAHARTLENCSWPKPAVTGSGWQL